MLRKPLPLVLLLAALGAALPASDTSVAADPEASASARALPETSASARALFIKASSRGVITLGGFHPRRDPSFEAAIRVFGEPSSRREYDANACLARWRDIGLWITFVNFGIPSDGSQGSACDPELGVAQRAVVRTRRAKRWRTARRLRIGHSERQVKRRHRRARRYRGDWWLVTGRNRIGGDCGSGRGCPYPIVEASITKRRVSAFRVAIGAGGD